MKLEKTKRNHEWNPVVFLNGNIGADLNSIYPFVHSQNSFFKMSMKYIFKYKGSQSRIHVSKNTLLKYNGAMKEIEKKTDHPLVWLFKFELTAKSRAPYVAIDRAEELEPGKYTLFDPQGVLNVKIIIYALSTTIILRMRAPTWKKATTDGKFEWMGCLDLKCSLVHGRHAWLSVNIDNVIQ